MYVEIKINDIDVKYGQFIIISNREFVYTEINNEFGWLEYKVLLVINIVIILIIKYKLSKKSQMILQSRLNHAILLKVKIICSI